MILRPDVQPIVTLIAPLSAVKHGIPSMRPAHPFVIRFAGEYWMYRWQTYNNRPPANSYFQRGSPADLSFRTVDNWPLQMEARQKLTQPIDLSCCGKVQMEIRNADKNAAGISLELFAIDDNGGELSLGMTPVNSRPDTSKDPPDPVAETLDFAVPVSPLVGMVQEFKVAFRRIRLHSGKSARIAIDRFLLSPR